MKKLLFGLWAVVLGGIMISVLSGCGAKKTESIKDFFKKHDMKAGTCISPNMITNPDYEKIILENFNSITLENAMKPDYILNKDKSRKSGEIVVEFNRDMKKILDWAKDNGLAVRGHTLIWHSQTPDWIFYEDFDVRKNLVSREAMLSRMESMIRQVFALLEEEGYIQLFYAYDVVNEAWMENGKMRDSKWLETIGEDYIWQAFYFADQYAPDYIDLYYNDYNEQQKTNTFLKFVDTLVDSDGRSLIDGIGFQAHLYTKDDLNAYFKTVDALAAKGLKVQLTEVDVCLGSYNKPLEADEANLKIQADFYRELVKGIVERVDSGSLKSDALTFWGFMDSLSWRKEGSPLMFDAEGGKKPAYYGIIQK